MRETGLRALMAGLAVAAAALGGAAEAAAQTTWKMHIVWVPARPEAQAFKKFADAVNDKAKGKLKIELHPGGSLGVKDVDMLRILASSRSRRSWW
jgi:TRAP-type C4-dicarboxylate transport system substrate-binding protein